MALNKAENTRMPLTEQEAIFYLEDNKNEILQEAVAVLDQEMFCIEYDGGALVVVDSEVSSSSTFRGLFERGAWAENPELIFAYFKVCSIVGHLTNKPAPMVDYIASELWKSFFIDELQLKAKLAYEMLLSSRDRVALELEGHQPTFKVFSRSFISLKGLEKLNCYISLDEAIKHLGYPDLSCSKKSTVIRYKSTFIEFDEAYEHFKIVDHMENDFIKVNDAQVRVSRLPLQGGDCLNTFRWVSSMPKEDAFNVVEA